jgi:hypothetical protein
MACECKVCEDCREDALNAARYRKIRALFEGNHKIIMGLRFPSTKYYIEVSPRLARYEGLTFEEMIDSLPSDLPSKNSILGIS